MTIIEEEASGILEAKTIYQKDYSSFAAKGDPEVNKEEM